MTIHDTFPLGKPYLSALSCWYYIQSHLAIITSSSIAVVREPLFSQGGHMVVYHVFCKRRCRGSLSYEWYPVEFPGGLTIYYKYQKGMASH